MTELTVAPQAGRRNASAALTATKACLVLDVLTLSLRLALIHAAF